jgi:hypothetical protein
VFINPTLKTVYNGPGNYKQCPTRAGPLCSPSASFTPLTTYFPAPSLPAAAVRMFTLYLRERSLPLSHQNLTGPGIPSIVHDQNTCRGPSSERAFTTLCCSSILSDGTGSRAHNSRLLGHFPADLSHTAGRGSFETIIHQNHRPLPSLGVPLFAYCHGKPLLKDFSWRHRPLFTPPRGWTSRFRHSYRIGGVLGLLALHVAPECIMKLGG